MSKKLDLIGKRFGRLLVIKEAQSENGETHWLCICDCGNEKTFRRSKLTGGYSSSCGCLNREKAIERFTKHGMSNTRIHRIWTEMLSRCNNHNEKCYKDYGGRGIKVCDEWREFLNFYHWAINNGYKKYLTIDRIDNNGIYEPNNCRWATITEQCNNRRSNVILEFNNRKQTATQWARELNISPKMVQCRIRHGWSVSRALLTPLQQQRKRDEIK